MLEKADHPITASDVREAIAEKNIGSWMLRKCSVCGAPIGYRIYGDAVSFDGNCACTSYWTAPRDVGVEGLVEVFNMQTPEVRARMWRDFLSQHQKGEGHE